MRDLVQTEVARVWRPALPFLVGGDHSIVLPALRGRIAHGPVAVVHVDAHLDTSDGAVWARTSTTARRCATPSPRV